MADVKWIKLAVGLPDDRKIRQIRKLPDGDTLALLWIFLMCLAGETNDNGMVYFTKEIPYTEEMLADQFRMEINTVRLGLQTFERFGMIEIVEDIILLSSWEKWQSAEKLEKIREDGRRRVAKHREKQKALAAESGSGACNVTSNADVTPCNAIEEEVEEEVEEEGESTAGKPPAPAPRKEPKKPEEPKHKYGAYGWVRLTDAQYAKLAKDLGQAELDRCIAYVDESAQSNSNKNKWSDWNLVIRKCNREGWGRNRGGYAPRSNGFVTSNPFMEMLNERRGNG